MERHRNEGAGKTGDPRENPRPSEGKFLLANYGHTVSELCNTDWSSQARKGLPTKTRGQQPKENCTYAIGYWSLPFARSPLNEALRDLCVTERGNEEIHSSVTSTFGVVCTPASRSDVALVARLRQDLQPVASVHLSVGRFTTEPRPSIRPSNIRTKYKQPMAMAASRRLQLHQHRGSLYCRRPLESRRSLNSFAMTRPGDWHPNHKVRCSGPEPLVTRSRASAVHRACSAIVGSDRVLPPHSAAVARVGKRPTKRLAVRAHTRSTFKSAHFTVSNLLLKIHHFKRDNPDKTRRPTASSGMIPKCGNPGVTRPGIGWPWWEERRLTAQPPRPLRMGSYFCCCSSSLEHVPQSGGCTNPLGKGRGLVHPVVFHLIAVGKEKLTSSSHRTHTIMNASPTRISELVSPPSWSRLNARGYRCKDILIIALASFSERLLRITFCIEPVYLYCCALAALYARAEKENREVIWAAID
ncbi:hypothetical protein PR048_024575 [Dryococelus australis]|uniref:Uncharacterized protein n=1 Tax=Dryococelus australis TaxID=614101 RepID=A0ABQ9GP02_9NEOP|nr:hypothetical protein PR048_024575 [Dryococelus australis]